MEMIENEWSKFNTCQEDIKILYKYRRLRSKNENNENIVDEHTLSMIKNGEIKLSAPDEFNDPFDCRIEFASQNKDDDNILKHFDTKPEIHRIFCLSKNPKNILMWSHYADNHSGVCIGYKVHRIDNKIGLKFKKGTFLKKFEDNYFGNIFWPIVKVEYGDIRPDPIDYIKAKKDDKYGMTQRLKFFSSKSTLWKYEEEYRLLMSKNFINMNPVYIKPSDVKEVIFGLYTPNSIMENIVKNVGNDSGIDFFKVEFVPRKYELEIVPLTV